jgi:predicted dehydrogenase
MKISPSSESTDKRVLVIGLGSIGRRHLALFNELGCETAACTGQVLQEVLCYENLENALNLFKPHNILIANATADHLITLVKLCELIPEASVLVEKPIFSKTAAPVPFWYQQKVQVAYNLRFHPAVLALREALRGESLVSAELYVGMHLSTWRAGCDYRQSYSAFKDRGGGVLSHEMDLSTRLFGNWKRLVAHGGHFSELEINTEDTVSILLETEFCPKVRIEVNYLDRAPRRLILIHTHQHTWEADLMGGRLFCDGMLIQSWELERNTTYRAQNQAWLSGDKQFMCSFQEGLAALQMIEATEHSISQQGWVQPSNI